MKWFENPSDNGVILPSGWEAHFYSLPMTMDFSDEWLLLGLTEDLVYIRNMSKELTIDIGWRQGDGYLWESRQINGCFICRLIENSDWQHPLQNIMGANVQEVIDWMNKVLTETK